MSDDYCAASDTAIDSLGRHYTRRGPVPQPREVVAIQRVTIRLSSHEHETAHMVASADETTLSDVIREALAEYAARRLR